MATKYKIRDLLIVCHIFYAIFCNKVDSQGLNTSVSVCDKRPYASINTFNSYRYDDVYYYKCMSAEDQYNSLSSQASSREVCEYTKVIYYDKYTKQRQESILLLKCSSREFGKKLQQFLPAGWHPPLNIE